METRPHFIDLRRRYREADWVSEFQRLWAIFNHWLLAYVGNQQDRHCIEDLKTQPNLTQWIDDIIQSTAYNFPHRVTDGYGGSYPRFAADNEISYFFRSLQESPVIEPRISYPWRVGNEPRVRKINTITLDDVQFRAVYEAHAQLLSENMTFDLTIHQTLPALGVYATGCCFYRGSVDASLPIVYANRMVDLFRTYPCLSSLVHMIESENLTSIADDVMESLYNVRNVAIHGSLDFLNEQDNAAARAAYDLLDSLIRDIRDRW